MKTNDELQRDVMNELHFDPQLGSVAAEIGVSARDSVVTLSGIVDTYPRKLAAERAAQRVKGVKVVAVDIEVRVPDSSARSDSEIAAAVRNALMWNTNVNEDKVEVKVDNGWVYLDGLVLWGYEKNAAETALQGLAGVRGITNNIKVRSATVEAQDIRHKIINAFQRNANVDCNTIRVEVHGHAVTLRGTVQSWFAREEAERVAWSSPGVTEVDNQIVIDTEVFA